MQAVAVCFNVLVSQNVQSIVDVWCEAPVLSTWKELADSAISEEDRKEKWGGLDYWFVMGTSLFTLYKLGLQHLF